MGGRFVVLLALAACAAPALAHPVSPELAAKFSRGEYLEAASEAEAAASADAYAFAARALLAQGMTQDAEPGGALIDRASRNAEAALELDPAHEEGKLQLAIALSLKSRAMAAGDVWSSGYGETSRKLALDVLRADPDNFYAHGFLAVWNVEVRRRGGAIGAAFMGASLREARRHYEAAVRLAPDDVGLHWQYARALVALDARRHRKEAERALDRALAAHVDDHIERVMRQRAQTLSQALRTDARSAQALARTMR